MTNDAYAIYSVGPNGHDDGGASLDQPLLVDPTMGGVPRETGDIGIQIRLSR